MVQLVYSATEIINDAVEQYEKKQQLKKELKEQYKDTPVSEIPVEDLVVVAEDLKVSQLPESVRTNVMNYMVQQKAERLGPLRDDEVSPEEKRYLESFSVRRGVTLDPISEAESMGISEGARTGVTGFLGRKLGIIDERNFTEEFNQRVKLARVELAGDMPKYYTGLVEGAIVADPIGLMLGGKGVQAAAQVGSKVLPKTPVVGSVTGATAGGALEGAGYGAMVPVYPEFGDSRARNMAIGATAGGVITAVPAAAVTMLTKTPIPPIAQPKLAPQPVALQPKALATETFTPRQQQIPKPTPVTGQATFDLDITPPSTVRMQNVETQISELQQKAKGLGRKKRKPIQKQIEKLEALKAAEINISNQTAKELNDKVVEIDKQIQRLIKVRQEAQPSIAGSKARVERSVRREQELLQEKDLILGLDRYYDGGYQVKLTDQAYVNPQNVMALKQRILATNTTGSQPDVVLPPPTPTGDPVTDAANRAIYMSMSDDVRIGLDAPSSLSAAGVRPQAQFAGETVAGVDEAAMTRAIEMSPSTARRDAKEPVGRPTGREEVLTAEERGRVSAMVAATAEQRKMQRAMAMGTEEDVETLLKTLPLGNDRGSIETAAEIFKRGVIGKNYNTLVDYVMDVHQDRMLTAIELEALRTLFVAVENRMVNSTNKLRKLLKEGRGDSPEAVELLEDIYFSTYIGNIRRSTGTEASRILSQLKATKAMVESNTRKVNTGKLITNLFGVECA